MRPDAFEVDAADYLLKPVRFDRLRQAVGRARLRRNDARARSSRRSSSRKRSTRCARKGALPTVEEDGFWVPERNGQRRVPIESIDWIEAARDYVLLHTQVRSHLLRITMAALEARLAGSPLLRVHRSAFVRPDRVVEVKRANRSIGPAAGRRRGSAGGPELRERGQGRAGHEPGLKITDDRAPADLGPSLDPVAGARPPLGPHPAQTSRGVVEVAAATSRMLTNMSGEAGGDVAKQIGRSFSLPFERRDCR